MPASISLFRGIRNICRTESQKDCKHCLQSFWFCGEDGIRTRGTGCPVRRFSKLLYGKNFRKYFLHFTAFGRFVVSVTTKVCYNFSLMQIY